jgi:signal transduction histidine kinase
MTLRHTRAAVWAIWILVAAFGVIQATAWIVGGALPQRPATLVQVVGAWIVILILAKVSTRLIGGLSRTLTQHQDRHTETLDHVERLEMWNAVLQVIARSVDVPLAFQALAQHLVRLVDCDRIGLALLSENGQEFQTYTARVQDEERRNRPRPEIIFKTDRTALGTVVRSCEPLVIDDTSELAPDFLDINVLHSAGLRSALLVPLVSKGRAVGTLNVVSRQLGAFDQKHIDVLLPIAEIFAVAHVAQQLQIAVGKYRSMEAMSELTLSIATEINSALQTIIGHCDLLERGYPDPDLHRDLATVMYQAQRISGLLDKMRAAAHIRLKEVAETVNQGGVPTSPESYNEGDGDKGMPGAIGETAINP